MTPSSKCEFRSSPVHMRTHRIMALLLFWLPPVVLRNFGRPRLNRARPAEMGRPLLGQGWRSAAAMVVRRAASNRGRRPYLRPAAVSPRRSGNSSEMSLHHTPAEVLHLLGPLQAGLRRAHSKAKFLGLLSMPLDFYGLDAAEYRGASSQLRPRRPRSAASAWRRLPGRTTRRIIGPAPRHGGRRRGAWEAHLGSRRQQTGEYLAFSQFSSSQPIPPLATNWLRAARAYSNRQRPPLP